MITRPAGSPPGVTRYNARPRPVPTDSGPASHCPDPAQSLGWQLASYGLNVFIHLGSRISEDLGLGLHLTSPEGQRSGTVASNEFVILGELSLAEPSPGSSLIG